MRSVREVEIVVGVVVVLALAEAGANEVEGHWEPRNAEPHTHAVVNDHTIEEEALEATVEEVEQPLLGCVGSVVPDIASCIGTLLVEVLLAVPRAVLHLGYSETLAVCKTHILHVAVFVVSQAAALHVHDYSD